MALYTLLPSGSVLRETDGALIPDAPGNSDYDAYTMWVQAGNRPDVPSAAVVAVPVVDPVAQLVAINAYRAAQFSKSGDYLNAYAVLNGLPLSQSSI